MSDLASRRANVTSYTRGWAKRHAVYGRTGRSVPFESRPTGDLTRREREVLAIVKAHRAEHGEPPSRRRLQALIGTSSRSYVDRVVAKLKERGEFPR
jgi:hypothetical protein